MLKARSVLIATVVVTNLAVGAVTIYAETPTKANFAACNADAPAVMRAGTATPDGKRTTCAWKQRGRTAQR